MFQHEIYSFIAGIDSGLPHTYARTHTHTQAHSSRALSLSTLPSRQLHAEKDSTRLRSCVSSCSCQQLWLWLLLLCSLLCSSLKRALCRRLFTTLQSHSEATWTRTRTIRTHSTAQFSFSLSLALSAHSVAAFYLPPEPCVSYEPRKATDSTRSPTAAAGYGASCVFGGAVGSTAHEADTTHASNILLSVVGHSRKGDSQQRGRRGTGGPNSCALCLHWAVS